MKINLFILYLLSLSLGCAEQGQDLNPFGESWGDANDKVVPGRAIGTNDLREKISKGMSQKEVELTLGQPLRILLDGVYVPKTNATGIIVDAPLDVGIYQCTNGTMWILFETNNVVDVIEEIKLNGMWVRK